MGLFNTILQKLGFMKDKAVEAVAGETAAAAEAPAAADAPAAAPETVDVVAVCEALAAKNPQKLNWRTSIVDLMKLLVWILPWPTVKNWLKSSAARKTSSAATILR